MTCPTCGAELRESSARCPVCEALVAPAVEGALAPKPSPMRELPGTRKKEKTWRDEVSERVRSRRKKKESETGLPLFDQAAPPEAPEAEDAPAVEKAPPPAPADPPFRKAPVRIEEAKFARVADEMVADLPLHPAPGAVDEEGATDFDDVPAAGAAPTLAPTSLDDARGRRPAPEPSRDRPFELDDAEPSAGDDEEWRVELEPPAVEPRPVERPAQFAERARAGAVDLALLAVMGAVVVYFASRAARVPVAGLLPAWPWLSGYLGFLGLAYATYFTGTTGQTLGKMVFDLRVVDRAGQPPGYLRAFLRAALGALSCAAAGLGVLPMAFDPARRGLHDRALRTRVVRG